MHISTTKKVLREAIHLINLAIISPDKQPVSLDEANDLQSFKFTLSVVGIHYSNISVKDLPIRDLRTFDVIILPFTTANNLNDSAIKEIKNVVNAGSWLITDGPSKIADAFNIQLDEKTIFVQQTKNALFPEIPLYWNPKVEVKPIYESVDNDYRVLFRAEDTAQPLVVSSFYGKGGFLFFAPLFDPRSPRGYSRFPFFIETFSTLFNYSPIAERKTTEMYFDPGLRQNISIEKLVQLWRQNGIKRIYAAGWLFYTLRNYTYDYERLVQTCHKNGILVYCWLEPPLISQRFWDKHPEWREKTAQLRDAKVGWRFLMNLADPDCRKAAFSEIMGVLTKYDWDGVNIAELYFDSPSGPVRPESPHTYE